MKRPLFLLAGLALTAALVLPSATANHSAGYHWRRGSNPFNVRMINGTSANWSDAVKSAAGKWTRKSTVLDINLKRGGAGCGAVSGRVKICSGSFGGGWAGLTEVAQQGPHIVWATVKLDNAALAAKHAVACHELGHALGLSHRAQSETSSCLTPSVSAAQRRPDSHDIRMLRRIYRHSDGGGKAGATGGPIVVRRYPARGGEVTVLRYVTYLD